MPADGGAPTPELLNRALHAIRTLRDRLDQAEAARKLPIAIIGMGCRFPGAPGLAAFWDLLCTGRDPLGPVPPERWDVDEFYSPDPQAPGKSVAREGGYLPDLEAFDPDFFGISPREAVFIDPRQRLTLETAWEALEDAGVPPRSLAGSRTAVFVGTLTDDYHQLITAEPHWVSAATGTGTANSIVANRISYFLDLRGPSVALDAACAGSLMAIHLGVKAIRDGEASLALCGGVAVNLLPSPDISFSRMGALAPYARCRTFDRDAAGMVRSEGAGMIVLKSLAQAQADGDRVHAVIRGGATNHDGRSNGIASPNGAAQEALLREAYELAGLAPGLVQYIEAHGTGTTVGDRIEIQALTRVLAAGRPDGRPVVIGSVKSNIGHTESAAGVAGVIKTALALRHRTIPPNLHIGTLTPALAEAPIAVSVHQAPGAFPAPQERLTAGVSSFSFGGSNVHLVLEEADPVPPAAATAAALPELRLLPISAASSAALDEQARQYAAVLQRPDRPTLADLCYTAAERRSHLEHRLVVAGRTADEIAGRLLAFADRTLADNPNRDALVSDRALRSSEVNLAFLFSGQGSEWLGMGHDLIAAEPVVAAAIARMEPLFQRHAGWSLQAALADITTWPRDIDVIQPTVFALQVALAALWQSWGVRPNAIVGQSMGEVAAAHVAGALDLEAAVQVIVARSRLLREAMRQGATAVIGLPANDVRAHLGPYQGRLDIAGVTSFTATLVAGETAAMQALLARLDEDGVFGRLLDTVEVAAHSPAMDPLAPRLAAMLADIVPHATSIPLCSTVTAAPIAGTTLDAAYWARNLRQPFRVTETLARMADDGCTLFLEVSPHPVMVGALRQCLDHLGTPGRALRSLTKALDGPLAMRSALGGLHAAGYPVEWQRWRQPEARHADLPTYPWQRTRYWVEAFGTPNLYVGSAARQGGHPLLGPAVELAGSDAVAFERPLERQSLPWLVDHALGDAAVLPGAAYLEMALAAARSGLGWDRAEVAQAAFERLLVLPGQGALTLQTQVRRTGADTALVEVHTRVAPDRLAPDMGDRSHAGAVAGSSDPENGAAPGRSWTRHATLRVTRLAATPEPAAPSSRSGLAEAAAEVAVAPASGPDRAAAGGRSAPLAISAVDGPPPGSMTAGTARHPDAGSVASEPALRDVDVDAFYADLRRRGLHYGAAFRGITSIAAEDGTVTADITLPAAAGGTGGYLLHPALLDAAIQAVAAALPVGDHVYLPRGAQKYSVFGPVPSQVRATARLADAVAGQPSLAATIALAAPDGRPVARIAQIELARVDAPTALAAAPDRMIYRLDWQPAGSTSAEHAWFDPSARPDYLVCADSGGFGAAIADELTRRGARCQILHRGPDVPAALRQAATRPLRGLIHLWSLDAPAPDVGGLGAIRTTLCGPVLEAVQAFAQHPTPIMLVTRGAQALRPDGADLCSLPQAALWGFGRVLALEHPELFGGLLDLDPHAGPQQAALAADALLATDPAHQVALRDGVPFRASLAPASLASSGGPMRFRPDATYLVTGGLSGLGLRTAQWLAERGARHLLLLGRSVPPPRGEWAALDPASPSGQQTAAVRALEALGSSVQFAACDVADHDTLAAVLRRQTQEMRPPIRGVVHAAGVLADRLLLGMTPDDLDAPMPAKIDGAWNLHCLTRDLPLDFFVLYSSAAAVLGQVGQANYAAANAFEDALAWHRRASGLPATSLGWGPWAEIGLYARRGLRERAGLTGVREITPADGMAALEIALQSGAIHGVVVDADWAQVPATPLLQALTAETATDTLPLDQEDAQDIVELLVMSPGERRRHLRGIVGSIVAAVLRLDPDRLDNERQLTGFGLDSIMAVEIRNRVRRRFGVTLPMVSLLTGCVVDLAGLIDTALLQDGALDAALAQVEGLTDPPAGVRDAAPAGAA